MDQPEPVTSRARDPLHERSGRGLSEQVAKSADSPAVAPPVRTPAYQTPMRRTRCSARVCTPEGSASSGSPRHSVQIRACTCSVRSGVTIGNRPSSARARSSMGRSHAAQRAPVYTRSCSRVRRSHARPLNPRSHGQPPFAGLPATRAAGRGAACRGRPRKHAGTSWWLSPRRSRRCRRTSRSATGSSQRPGPSHEEQREGWPARTTATGSSRGCPPCARTASSAGRPETGW